MRSVDSVGGGGLWPSYQPAPQHSGRLHLHAVTERPAGIDEQLGDVFRRMREMAGGSTAGVASALGTSPGVIALLESGAVRALPPWPETERVVLAYGRLLRLDAQPLLERIAAQAAAPVIAGTQSAAQDNEEIDIPTMPSPGDVTRNRRRRSRARRTFLAVSAPMAIAGLCVYLAQAQPPMMIAAVNALPNPISRPLRGAMDYMLVQSAPRKDGLRWIEVADPRTRKADRLAVPQR